MSKTLERRLRAGVGVFRTIQPHGRYGAWSGELHAVVSSKESWDPIEHKGEKRDTSGIPGESWVATVLNQMREKLPQLHPLYFPLPGPEKRHY